MKQQEIESLWDGIAEHHASIRAEEENLQCAKINLMAARKAYQSAKRFVVEYMHNPTHERVTEWERAARERLKNKVSK